MSGINNVGSTFSELGLGAPSGGKESELGQADFLELLVSQMRNQNPLEPEGNGEFISQMAQFGTVDGINKMQEQLGGLVGSLQSGQALQATALVGRSVYVPGNTGQLDAGGSIKGAAQIDTSASDITMQIYNQSGELVRTMQMGSSTSGSLDWTWDGKNESGEALPAGNYGVKAEGFVGGERKAFSTLVAANVDSVTLGTNGAGIKLNIAGVGSLALDQVARIN